jgi:excisionase family DNA binding protein
MREWLTLREAAAYLKVGVSTLYRWMDEGTLRYYELESGGGRRFRREDLDALLKPGREDEG